MSESKFNVDTDGINDNISENKTSEAVYEKGKAVSGAKSFYRLITFAIASILLLLSFCPMAYVALEDNGASIKESFSTVDSISLAVKSFSFLSEEQMAEKYGTDTLVEPRDFSFKEHLAYTFMKADTSIRWTVVFTGVVSVVYIIFCLITFILAAKSLLSKSNKAGDKVKYEKSDSWLFASLFILPLTIFSFLQMCHFGVSDAVSAYKSTGVGASFGAVISLILAITNVLVGYVKNQIVLNLSFERKINKEQVKKAICVFLPALAIISLFLPCISIKTYAPDGTGDKNTLSFATHDVYEITADDISYYKSNSRRDCFEIIIGEVKASFDKTSDNANRAEDVFNLIVSGYCRLDLRIIFIAKVALTLFTLIFVGFILVNALASLIFNKKLEDMGVLKTMSLICAGMDLILIAVLVVIINSTLYSDFDFSIFCVPGVGALLSIVSMVAFIFACGEQQHHKTVGVDFDNPDVSYAPYVVGRK